MLAIRETGYTGIRNKWFRLIIHLVLWYLLTFIYIISLYLNSANSNFSVFIRLDTFVLNYGILGTINFLVFYTLVFYIIPVFLHRKRKVQLGLVILGFILVAGMIKYAVAWQFREHLLVKIGYTVPISIPKGMNASHPSPANAPRSSSVTAATPAAAAPPAAVPSAGSAAPPSSLNAPHPTTPLPASLTSPPVTAPAKPIQNLPRSYYQGPLEYSLESLLAGLMIAVAALAYRILLDWYKNEQIRKALEHEKLKAELAFLKMQVNPHFLFNSLNNLYSLSVLEKTVKTSDGIMRLSEMIRYMLYEKEDDQSRVSLTKEVQHLNSYIDLQRLRYESGMYLHFSMEGNIEQARIAPLLLFPLLENACKHGVVDDPKRPVTVELRVAPNQIIFSIRNDKNQHFKDHTGGIGLENVRKRLALLYPDRHTIQIEETATDFFVQLHLPL
jgi:two-component system, LytTR family, sensor kinase